MGHHRLAGGLLSLLSGAFEHFVVLAFPGGCSRVRW